MIRTAPLRVLLLLAVATAPTLAQGGSSTQALDFLVGQWQAVDDGAGAAGGEGGATVVGRWGPRGAWLTLDSTSVAADDGYGVHVVLYHDAARGRYAAFSINTLGTVATYWGELAGDALVLTGSAGADRRKLQRVTYRRQPEGRIRFTVERSDDAGGSYRAFSEAMWHPLSDEAGGEVSDRQASSPERDLSPQ